MVDCPSSELTADLPAVPRGIRCYDEHTLLGADEHSHTTQHLLRRGGSGICAVVSITATLWSEAPPPRETFLRIWLLGQPVPIPGDERPAVH